MVQTTVPFFLFLSLVVLHALFCLRVAPAAPELHLKRVKQNNDSVVSYSFGIPTRQHENEYARELKRMCEVTWLHGTLADDELPFADVTLSGN